MLSCGPRATRWISIAAVRVNLRVNGTGASVEYLARPQSIRDKGRREKKKASRDRTDCVTAVGVKVTRSARPVSAAVERHVWARRQYSPQAKREAALGSKLPRTRSQPARANFVGGCRWALSECLSHLTLYAPFGGARVRVCLRGSGFACGRRARARARAHPPIRAPIACHPLRIPAVIHHSSAIHFASARPPIHNISSPVLIVSLIRIPTYIGRPTEHSLPNWREQVDGIRTIHTSIYSTFAIHLLCIHTYVGRSLRFFHRPLILTC